MNLNDILGNFDQNTDKELLTYYQQIECKSKALANSLRRCFNNARQSKRFEAAYLSGRKGEHSDLSSEDLLDVLIAGFKEEDFLIFREFVRLLRACSLHIGGQISKEIKRHYTQTLNGKRVLLSYEAGCNEAGYQGNNSHS